MPLFPRPKVQFQTPLTPAQVTERLANVLKPSQSAPKPSWLGSVRAEGFEIFPRARDENAAKVKFTGKASAISGGSRVEGVVAMHPLVEVLLVVSGLAFVVAGLVLGSHDKQFLALPSVALVSWALAFFKVTTTHKTASAMVARVLEVR
jgi:hypothetical protein